MNNKNNLTDTYYVARVYYKKVPINHRLEGPILTTTIIRERKDGNYIDCRIPNAILSFDFNSHVEICPRSIEGHIYQTLSDSFELATQPKGKQISPLINEKKKERPVVLKKNILHPRIIHVRKKGTE